MLWRYGANPSSISLREKVAFPRLLAAAKGEHPIPSGTIMSNDENLDGNDSKAVIMEGCRRPISPDARAVQMYVGASFGHLDKRAAIAVLDYEKYPAGSTEFFEALANVEGLFAVSSDESTYFATSANLKLRAVYVGSENFFDAYRLDEIRALHEDFLSKGGRIRIYFHRGIDERSIDVDSSVEVRRVPFSLTIMAAIS